MPIKGGSIKFEGIPKIDQRWKDNAGTAEVIRPARIDPSGDGWLFDRGLEPWKSFAGSTILESETSPYLTEKVDSFFIWTKQSTGQVYHIVEMGGELFYLWGNNNSPASATNFWQDKVTIATGRRRRKPSDPGTQYIPFANKLLIINGYDKPILFYGEGRWRDFGFSIATPTPELLPIQVKWNNSTANALKEGIFDPAFSSSDVIGLGDTGDTDSSFYSYKMSFISDTGSESPLGGSASVSWENEAGFTSKHGVFINELSTGKKGIVARRLYRTKNKRLAQQSDSRDEIYYLVKQFNDNSTTEYIDIVPDTSLVEQAPSILDSTSISTTWAFGSSWNNRLWLAGGSDHPTRIIYSDIGFPEQFGAGSYFDVGATEGGHITALFAHYNSLLVFRESAIDIIRYVDGILTISTLTSDVGTTATSTITLVPNVGITFLSKDGIYTLSGGLEGGAISSVKKISDLISKDLTSMSIPALPSAIAAYSKKEKEYWIHYVRKGETVPTKGVVLHTYNGSFSFRGSNDSASEYLWSFTAMAVDPEGNFIFGTRPSWKTLAGAPASPTTTNAIGRLIFLQVWSGSYYWGESLSVGAQQLQPSRRTYTGGLLPKEENLFESNWIDFGDPSLKYRVFSVEAEMVTYGDKAVSLDWGSDYSVVWSPAGDCKISKPELIFTAGEDPVFGPAPVTVTKAPFVIGTSSLRSGRKVIIRWDVNTSLVETFRFRIRGAAGTTFHLLGFKINLDSREQLPLNQRANVGAY